MLTELLKLLNPWWITGQISPQKTQIIRDEVLGQLLPLLDPKEILVLSGVRRSGKSTLIFQIISEVLATNPSQNILFFSCDEPLEERPYNLIEQIYNAYLELNNPKGRKFIFLDEIQLIPEWERWIKTYYDNYGTEIKFILSGSNNLMLPTQLSILLSGRMLSHNIFPLSFSEYLKFKQFSFQDFTLQKSEIKYYANQYLTQGGFPEVVLEPNSEINQQRLREYQNSIILRDIVTKYNIREISKLTDLVKYVMANISSLLSYNIIAKNIGMSNHSVKEFISYLEDAFLCFTVRFFSYSIKQTINIQKPVKIYCIDTGLREAIAYKVFQDESPKLAENLVFLTLKENGKEIFYWQGFHEIDFVIRNKDNSLTAINVTYTNNIPEREYKGFQELQESLPALKLKNQIIISEDVEQENKIIQIIPLWKWLNISQEFLSNNC